MARGRNLSIQEQLEMWEMLGQVQDVFPYTEEGFLMFANHIINTFIPSSPDLARMQRDMCKYLFGGHKYRLIMAQRGQAKTTLCAIYAVFCLIHFPTTRILIFSAGGKMSKEIANFIIQIVEGLEELAVLRPDVTSGDRGSVEAYDIHWVFRGTEKAPSVKCLGVDSNAQGSRADLVIADDIESMKNSRTVMAREILEELTKEFETICQDGQIVYLGTPQSSESIYNNLPSRGYDVRIWTGRYPNKDELRAYGDFLAPTIVADMEADPSLREGYGLGGMYGAPTCPEMFSDNLLMEKEISLGSSKFQLQYMLNTRLSDMERYPLKLSNLIVTEFGVDEAPVGLIWNNDPLNVINELPMPSNKPTDILYRPMRSKLYDIQPFEQRLMYIDPAGGGKNSNDETGYAIVKLIKGVVYVAECGGVAGGYEEDKFIKLALLAKKHNVNTVWVEKNMGNGAYLAVMKPVFLKHHKCTFEEHYVTNQKEVRIIDTIEPLLTGHRLVIHPHCFTSDRASVEIYPTELKKTYRFAFQMTMITRDKGCLRHDDRLDALAGAIYQITEMVQLDTDYELLKQKEAEIQAFTNAWRNPHTMREDIPVTDDFLNAGQGVLFKPNF